MNGKWAVNLENGAHIISADLNIASGFLSVFYDNQQIRAGTILWMAGEIYKFEQDGHQFTLRVKGLVYVGGSLVLVADGTEVREGTTLMPTKSVTTPLPVTLLSEANVSEAVETISVEEYPLDNRFGGSPLTVAQEISKTMRSDVTIENTMQGTGKVNFDVLSVFKAEISAQLTRQVSQAVGEEVTRRQTVTFSVGPNARVVYTVTWKQKIRTGQYIFLVNESQTTVPYRINYDLSCEITSREG